MQARGLMSILVIGSHLGGKGDASNNCDGTKSAGNFVILAIYLDPEIQQ